MNEDVHAKTVADILSILLMEESSNVDFYDDLYTIDQHTGNDYTIRMAIRGKGKMQPLPNIGVIEVVSEGAIPSVIIDWYTSLQAAPPSPITIATSTFEECMQIIKEVKGVLCI